MSSSPKEPKPKHPQGVKTLLEDPADATDSDHDSEEYGLFAVGCTDGIDPIVVELELDGQRVRMEVDTGASLSVVSETTFARLWPGRSLEPSTVQLKTYTGEALQV